MVWHYPHTQNSCSHFVQWLPVISYCCCNMPASHWHREVTWLKDMLTPYPVLFCMFWMFCMRFANLKKFHKALCRTHQIKGQYELLCLKWLESELTTGQHFLHLHMSSLWFLCFFLYMPALKIDWYHKIGLLSPFCGPDQFLLVCGFNKLFLLNKVQCSYGLYSNSWTPTFWGLIWDSPLLSRPHPWYYWVLEKLPATSMR